MNVMVYTIDLKTKEACINLKDLINNSLDIK